MKSLLIVILGLLAVGCSDIRDATSRLNDFTSCFLYGSYCSQGRVIKIVEVATEDGTKEVEVEVGEREFSILCQPNYASLTLHLDNEVVELRLRGKDRNILCSAEAISGENN